MKTIGRPRSPERPGMWPWGAADTVAGVLLWLLVVLVEMSLVLLVAWCIITIGIPWIIDVIMDAIESRQT